ncbi:10589_t:CDS:1, partial [Ambispora gerdemannii]
NSSEVQNDDTDELLSENDSIDKIEELQEELQEESQERSQGRSQERSQRGFQ